MASCEPIESPSGRECEESTNRCRVRTASTIRAISGLVVVIRGGSRSARPPGAAGANVVEQLFDPVLAGNRFVVVELQLGGALEAQARAELAAQERRGAAERLGRGGARLVVAERGVVDPRVLQVGRDLHSRNGDEPDPRVVHVARQHRRDLAADLIGDSVWAGTLSHGNSEFRIWNLECAANSEFQIPNSSFLSW